MSRFVPLLEFNQYSHRHRPRGEWSQWGGGNPAGNRVYVTNRFDGTVSVIDPAINKAVTAVTVEEGPSGVAVDPAGSRIYVANTGDDTVSVLDAKTYKITATVPVGNDPKAFGQFIGKPSSRPTKTRLSS